MKYPGSGNAIFTLFATKTPTVRIDAGTSDVIWLAIDFGFGSGEIRVCYSVPADSSVSDVVRDLRNALTNVDASDLAEMEVAQ